MGRHRTNSRPVARNSLSLCRAPRGCEPSRSLGASLHLLLCSHGSSPAAPVRKSPDSEPPVNLECLLASTAHGQTREGKRPASTFLCETLFYQLLIVCRNRDFCPPGHMVAQCCRSSLRRTDTLRHSKRVVRHLYMLASRSWIRLTSPTQPNNLSASSLVLKDDMRPPCARARPNKASVSRQQPKVSRERTLSAVVYTVPSRERPVSADIDFGAVLSGTARS